MNKLDEFEFKIAQISSKCAIEYGGMGAVGFLYESIKDELNWAGIRRKWYVSFIRRIGNLYVLDDEAYNKQKVENLNMNTKEIATKLISIFGAGE